MLVVFLGASAAWAQENPPPEPTAPPASPEAVDQAPPAPPEAVDQAPPGPTAPAPAAGPQAAKQVDRVEEILVTGSRIRTKAIDRTAPIVTLGADEMARSGIVSVGDMLQRLPSSGAAVNTRFNQSGNAGFSPDGAGTSAGSAEIDLRYLTSKRTLVLVDGVRWVPGAAASGVPAASDLNTIPMAMIERIEVLQDGASTVYGSDAIGGVVNVITKKRVEGFHANAQIGGYAQEGDGASQQYDLVWGTGGERGSTVVGISYSRQNAVWSKDRDLTKVDVPGLGVCIPGFCSSTPPRGRFRFTDPNTNTVNDLTLVPGSQNLSLDELVYNPSAPSSGSFQTFGGSDRFDYQPYNMVLNPLRRMGAFTQVDYVMSPKVHLNAKLLFNNRSSGNQAAPEPLVLGTGAGTGTRADRLVIDAANTPFGFGLDTSSTWTIRRRTLEAGPRIFDQNVNTWYGSGGLLGQFSVSERTFSWDATAFYSQNRAEQVKRNGINVAKLERALGPRAACAADPGCVPANLFGGNGSFTPELLSYIKYEQHDLSDQTLWGAVGNVTGDLFRLPGGMLGLAVGVEHRDLSGAFRPDAVVAAGDTGDVPAQPTSGSYYVSEAYAEALAPLVSDVPGAEALELTAAVRASRYSTFGTTSALRAGVRWRPVQDLVLRGSVAQGFRAPGIGELFGSPGRYDANLRDPCNSPETLPAAVAQRCRQLGVPDGYTQDNTQLPVTTGGNRDLEPERSLGWVGSVVFSPSAVANSSVLDRLDLEVSYYNIQLDDAITTDPQVYLSQCIAGDDAFCEGIERSVTGEIVSFNNRLRNIGGIRTAGIDWALSLGSAELGFGRLRLDWTGNYLLEYTEDFPATTGLTPIKRVGKELGDPMKGYPRIKSTGVLSYFGNDVGASVGLRYIHSITESCQDLDAYDLCSDEANQQNKLDATLYADAQVTWVPAALERTFSVTVGVNNVLNTDPPVCYSCALNNYDASIYDVPGRFAFVRAGYQL